MYQKPRTQLKPTSLSSLFTPKCLLNQKLLLLPSWKPKPNKTYKSVTILASFPPGPTSAPTQTLISLLRSIPDWANAVQECDMQKKRALYTHQNWRDHCSSLRHLRHVFSSLSSRVILSLVPPVLFFTAFAAAIVAYNEALLLHLLPDFLPLLRASSLPYQLILQHKRI
ncbi:UPF0187 protein, chloroplastic [Glycine max]|uniref:UPF0187 protein At2g45870, chloroplastic-like n=1 Tax=Glycine max TaxID=3847 RepID=UPI0003DE95EB|nr:UPF0187 protein At2g45870, chloroplastic-like [Glycine max]KAG5089461.1 hypothetical protein JHK86_002073 [Glycine max]KAH1266954.1 UPF0187 protein, chloroplastic [Glycine max]|eukprot:XP_006574293.1 UPF0187 protein At2g45870, chloroplastic-like [Glycine max]